MTLQLQLLDSFQATIDHKKAQFRTDKIRGLLAYLVLQEGMPQQKGKLATLLWGNKDDRSARTNLRVSLSRLKKTIDKHSPSPLSDKLLITTNKTIQLVLDDPAVPVWVDVLVIQKLLATCDAHQHQAIEQCSSCLARLAQAADLYQGEFLPGIQIDDSETFYEWVIQIREQLHQQVLNALDTVVTGLTAQQRLEEVLDYGQKLLKMEPWHEKTHRHLMLLLASDGQRAAAMNQYERCCQILREEMGLEPSAETVALNEKIASQQPLQAPQSYSNNPQRISAGKRLLTRHNLPNRLTSFFGRQTEQKQLIQRLLNPDYRFLTVTGGGGVGKSRLTLEVAKQLLASFEDGIWLVSLAELDTTTDPETAEERIAAAIAQALNYSLGGEGSYKSQLIQQLQGRHLLLLLDNFEHLMEGGHFVFDLLQETTAVSVLCTSRTPLGFMAEYIFPIQQLPLPESNTTVPLTHFPSIELFIDRAKRVTGSFELAPENEADIITLCHQVSGIPLGLELAAAMLRQQSLPDTVALIQQSLDAIKTMMRDIPARHASMRAVFESSWLLLSTAEQQIMAQLAVFRGGFDLTAATAVVGAERTMLDTLKEKSMLTRTLDNEARYGMHELLRQFAAEKQQHLTDSPAEVGQHHSRYYLQFLAAREQAIAGAKPQDEVAVISADYPNIEQAWLWAVAHKNGESLLAGAQTLADYLHLRGRYRDGARLFRQGAEALEQIVQPSYIEERAIAHMHVHEAAVLVRLGRYDEAFQLAQTVLEEGDTLSDSWVQGYAHLHLTECLWRRGNYDDAIHQAQAIIKFAEDAQAQRLTGAGYYHLNIAYNFLGQYEEAESHVQTAVKLWTDVNNVRLTAYALNSLGLIFTAQKLWGNAEQVFKRALKSANQIGDWQAKTNILLNLSWVAVEHSNFEQAEAHLTQLLQDAQQVGDKTIEAQVFHNLGFNAFTQGDWDTAHTFLMQALAVKMSLKDIQNIALTSKVIGDVLAQKGEYEEAHNYYQQTLQLSEQIKNRHISQEAIEAIRILQNMKKDT